MTIENEVQWNRFHPRVYEDYWIVGIDEVKRQEWWNDPTDIDFFNSGNCFQSAEQAEEALSRRDKTFLAYHAEIKRMKKIEQEYDEICNRCHTHDELKRFVLNNIKGDL